MNIDKERKKRILFKAIDDFELDLSGLNIFTEIASGNYLYTSIACVISGANSVYGIVKDSLYSPKEKVLEEFDKVSKWLGIENNIFVTFDKCKNYISECDIITNSGFVRPITRDVIDCMKPTAVIPLMFESWEFDSSCIDLDYCKKKGILVVGTNEHHELLNLFSTIPYKICKLLFDSKMSIYNNNILLISSGEIGNIISNFFNINKISFDRISFSKCEDISNFDLSKYDVIIISELYHKEINILSENGFISTKELKKINPLIQIIYTYGLINKKDIDNYELSIFPDFDRNITGDYLSPEITIRLNVASLKVAEIVSRYRLRGKTVNQVLDSVSKNNLIDTGLYNE